MGMFDSIYAPDGIEWQTKAYGCNLSLFRVGCRMPKQSGRDRLPADYQLSVIGCRDVDYWQYATVRNGVLTEVPCVRDTSLPLVDYYGGPAMFGAGEVTR